jgi:hypothetical protein
LGFFGLVGSYGNETGRGWTVGSAIVGTSDWLVGTGFIRD